MLRGEAPGDTLQPITHGAGDRHVVSRRERPARHALRLCRGRGRSGRAAERQSAIEPRRGNSAAVTRTLGHGIMETRNEIDGSHLSNQAGHGRTTTQSSATASCYWLKGDVFGDYELGEPVAGGMPHRFLAPVMPSIVVCIGLNYKDHAAEMNKKLPAEPLVFLKPQSSVIGPEDDDPDSGVGRAHRARGRDGGRDRQARVERQGRRRDGLRARHHLPQRRHRARAAGQGRAVFARQGLRHVLRRSVRASPSASIRPS